MNANAEQKLHNGKPVLFEDKFLVITRCSEDMLHIEAKTNSEGVRPTLVAVQTYRQAPVRVEVFYGDTLPKDPWHYSCNIPLGERR